MYRPGPTHEAGGNRYPASLSKSLGKRENGKRAIKPSSLRLLLSLPLSYNEFTTLLPMGHSLL